MKYFTINGTALEAKELPHFGKEISKKEYDSLLAEQTKKQEEIIATRNAENAKKLEILKASGLTDEAIAILAPSLIK